MQNQNEEQGNMLFHVTKTEIIFKNKYSSKLESLKNKSN